MFIFLWFVSLIVPSVNVQYFLLYYQGKNLIAFELLLVEIFCSLWPDNMVSHYHNVIFITLKMYAH